MTGESKEYPERIVRTRKMYQVRYNRTQETRTTEEGEESFWVYEYVMIQGEVTRKKLIDAMIRNRYDVNDEINLINDNLTDENMTEYQDYRDYVEVCKNKADEIINELGA